MVELTVFNPVSQEAEKTKIELSPRLSDLRGKTIGLFWNGKSGGDIMLGQIKELLNQRYGEINFKNYIGSGITGWAGGRGLTTEQADAIVKECDALIESTAD